MSQTIKSYKNDITEAYKCEDCNYESFQKSDMERNINSNQYNIAVKVYKCNFCREKYKWINSLKQHMKKHEGYDEELDKEVLADLNVKLNMYGYKCTYCGYTSKWKSDVKRHQKRNFACSSRFIAHTSGTERTAVNVATNGEHISCTDKEVEKLVSAQMKEFDRKIELGQKVKFILDKHAFKKVWLSHELKDAL